MLDPKSCLCLSGSKPSRNALTNAEMKVRGSIDDDASKGLWARGSLCGHLDCRAGSFAICRGEAVDDLGEDLADLVFDRVGIVRVGAEGFQVGELPESDTLKTDAEGRLHNASAANQRAVENLGFPHIHRKGLRALRLKDFCRFAPLRAVPP